MTPAYWLPLVVFLPHVVEEWSHFPDWATRHFGATSRAYYLYSHIVLIAADVLICSQAASGARGSTWAILATGAQVVLLTNGVFHLTTTFHFREYSPGVVTGCLLFFPSSYYLLERTITLGWLTPGELALAVTLGVLTGGAVIASLWLRMDLDWRLRRMGR